MTDLCKIFFVCGAIHDQWLWLFDLRSIKRSDKQYNNNYLSIIIFCCCFF